MPGRSAPTNCDLFKQEGRVDNRATGSHSLAGNLRLVFDEYSEQLGKTRYALRRAMKPPAAR